MAQAAVSLDDLRARIRAMERLTPAPAETLSVHPEIDPSLPGRGLAPAAVHQVIAEDAAGTAFVALLAGRLTLRERMPVLWVTADDTLYPPGLAAWGLAPQRLLTARAGSDTERLWVMEEALRCPDLAAVVGEIQSLDLTAGRRLQLAAEAGGVTGFLLHPRQVRAANAGTTRWRVGSAPQGRWRLVLERCRGGLPGAWEITPPGPNHSTR